MCPLIFHIFTKHLHVVSNTKISWTACVIVKNLPNKQTTKPIGGWNPPKVTQSMHVRNLPQLTLIQAAVHQWVLAFHLQASYSEMYTAPLLHLHLRLCQIYLRIRHNPPTKNLWQELAGVVYLHVACQLVHFPSHCIIVTYKRTWKQSIAFDIQQVKCYRALFARTHWLRPICHALRSALTLYYIHV